MAASTEVFHGSENDLRISAFCEEVATLIGKPVNPQRVANVINLSNRRNLLVHGVKRISSLQSIYNEGIKPLTPENGFVSFWTTGIKIFGDIGNKQIGKYFDSPFFNYAQSSNDDSQDRTMIIAVTNKENVVKVAPYVPIEPNSYVTVDKTISRNLIKIVIIQKNAKSRGSIEQEMFSQMEAAFSEEFRPGDILVSSI